MKQLLILISLFTMIGYSCNDKNSTEGSNTADSTNLLVEKKVSTDSSQLLATNADSLPYFEFVPRDEALGYIESYASWAPVQAQKTIPRMIWLSKKHLKAIYDYTDNLKIVFGRVAMNKVIPFIQIRRNGKFEYYKMKESKTKFEREESSFCPVPYPCSTVEDLEQSE